MKKVKDILSFLLGPFRVFRDFEILTTKVDYLFKKYHQEFWSGMGVETVEK